MPVLPRLVALACALPLALAGCSSSSSTEPSPSLERIVTDPKSTVAASPSPVPTSVGGPAIAAVTEQHEIVGDLDAPWDMEFMTDGSLLVTERDTATIRRVRAGFATVLNGPGAEALRSTVMNAGEGGLLGIAVLEGDVTYLYAYITREDDNAVLRMELHDDLLSLPTPVIEGIPSAKNHDGGRMRFGPDGFLYISVGDAGKPELAPNTDSLAGKILRVIADGSEADGKAAPDNPWKNRVWSRGHRNVEGFGWVADGRMYASELGQDSADELNLIKAGANYGWPAHEGFSGAPSGTAPGTMLGGYTFPVATWDPDEASPSGIGITHEAIYMASLKGERLWRIPLTTDGIGEPHVILDGMGRLRDAAAAPDGSVYVLTNNTDGRGTPTEGDDRLLGLTIG
ncbi:PQQ-dependent sugar dehydrogenase [Demequina sp.]|uniref:PQQ-dependent sugar dehydrogenase n=1 Tax=Demequina sp. TaxID=2050685 RepID=UPI0025F2EBC5|nr:PQQ-dependent sugar dehydrogenase [Demequina sp.]